MSGTSAPLTRDEACLREVSYEQEGRDGEE